MLATIPKAMAKMIGRRKKTCIGNMTRDFCRCTRYCTLSVINELKELR